MRGSRNAPDTTLNLRWLIRSITSLAINTRFCAALAFLNLALLRFICASICLGVSFFIWLIRYRTAVAPGNGLCRLGGRVGIDVVNRLHFRFQRFECGGRFGGQLLIGKAGLQSRDAVKDFGFGLGDLLFDAGNDSGQFRYFAHNACFHLFEVQFSYRQSDAGPKASPAGRYFDNGVGHFYFWVLHLSQRKLWLRFPQMSPTMTASDAPIAKAQNAGL